MLVNFTKHRPVYHWGDRNMKMRAAHGPEMLLHMEAAIGTRPKVHYRSAIAIAIIEPVYDFVFASGANVFRVL